MIELECPSGHEKFPLITKHSHGDACCKSNECEPVMALSEGAFGVAAALLFVLVVLAMLGIMALIGAVAL